MAETTYSQLGAQYSTPRQGTTYRFSPGSGGTIFYSDRRIPGVTGSSIQYATRDGKTEITIPEGADVARVSLGIEGGRLPSQAQPEVRQVGVQRIPNIVTLPPLVGKAGQVITPAPPATASLPILTQSGAQQDSQPTSVELTPMNSEAGRQAEVQARYEGVISQSQAMRAQRAIQEDLQRQRFAEEFNANPAARAAYIGREIILQPGSVAASLLIPGAGPSLDELTLGRAYAERQALDRQFSGSFPRYLTQQVREAPGVFLSPLTDAQGYVNIPVAGRVKIEGATGQVTLPSLVTSYAAGTAAGAALSPYAGPIVTAASKIPFAKEFIAAGAANPNTVKFLSGAALAGYPAKESLEIAQQVKAAGGTQAQAEREFFKQFTGRTALAGAFSSGLEAGLKPSGNPVLSEKQISKINRLTALPEEPTIAQLQDRVNRVSQIVGVKAPTVVEAPKGMAALGGYDPVANTISVSPTNVRLDQLLYGGTTPLSQKLGEVTTHEVFHAFASRQGFKIPAGAAASQKALGELYESALIPEESFVRGLQTASSSAGSVFYNPATGQFASSIPASFSALTKGVAGVFGGGAASKPSPDNVTVSVPIRTQSGSIYGSTNVDVVPRGSTVSFMNEPLVGKAGERITPVSSMARRVFLDEFKKIQANPSTVGSSKMAQLSGPTISSAQAPKQSFAEQLGLFEYRQPAIQLPGLFGNLQAGAQGFAKGAFLSLPLTVKGAYDVAVGDGTPLLYRLPAAGKQVVAGFAGAFGDAFSIQKATSAPEFFKAGFGTGVIAGPTAVGAIGGFAKVPTKYVLPAGETVYVRGSAQPIYSTPIRELGVPTGPADITFAPSGSILRVERTPERLIGYTVSSNALSVSQGKPVAGLSIGEFVPARESRLTNPPRSTRITFLERPVPTPKGLVDSFFNAIDEFRTVRPPESIARLNILQQASERGAVAALRGQVLGRGTTPQFKPTETVSLPEVLRTDSSATLTITGTRSRTPFFFEESKTVAKQQEAPRLFDSQKILPGTPAAVQQIQDKQVQTLFPTRTRQQETMEVISYPPVERQEIASIPSFSIPSATQTGSASLFQTSTRSVSNELTIQPQATRSRFFEATKVQPITRPSQRTTSLFQTSTRSVQPIRFAELQGQRQKQLTLTVQAQRQRTQSRQTTRFAEPKFLFVSKPEKGFGLKAAKKASEGGFFVFGRRGGKPVLLEKNPLPYGEAVTVGKMFAERTLGASFVPVPTNLPARKGLYPSTPVFALSNFRSPKGNSKLPAGSFVQKERFRLSSPTERAEIKAARGRFY